VAFRTSLLGPFLFPTPLIRRVPPHPLLGMGRAASHRCSRPTSHHRRASSSLSLALCDGLSLRLSVDHAFIQVRIRCSRYSSAVLPPRLARSSSSVKGTLLRRSRGISTNRGLVRAAMARARALRLLLESHRPRDPPAVNPQKQKSPAVGVWSYGGARRAIVRRADRNLMWCSGQKASCRIR
jgi:hypothetical protein